MNGLRIRTARHSLLQMLLGTLGYFSFAPAGLLPRGFDTQGSAVQDPDGFTLGYNPASASRTGLVLGLAARVNSQVSRQAQRMSLLVAPAGRPGPP